MRSEFLASSASPPPYVAVVLPGQQALGEPEKQSCFLWDGSRKGIVHDEIGSGQQPSVGGAGLLKSSFPAFGGREERKWGLPVPQTGSPTPRLGTAVPKNPARVLNRPDSNVCLLCFLHFLGIIY